MQNVAHLIDQKLLDGLRYRRIRAFSVDKGSVAFAGAEILESRRFYELPRLPFIPRPARVHLAVVAFTRRRRSGIESWRARWPQRAESDGHDSMAQAYQQRSTQSWVKISRLTGAAADAAQWVAPG